ncbi:hypothetical protein M422DRAFT_276490 [Sphaerobolus stellatus SS14]|uniref:Uncharacterized protein n=1 Tax=Sphaerobolus stellatus (strain SS14) TaxID=990650 RepID=A0A0C9UC45_SPHS4|nr:hypothetical protein M422DRAFT_276490 [Sphaerobolus stellatus SS14]
MFPFARIFGHDTDYPPLFTTLPPILVYSGFFAVSALLTHLYVKRNGPIPFATPLRTLNNALYASFSFYFAIQLSLSVYSWARLASFRYPSELEVARSLLTETLPDRSDMRLRYIYHISKFYEFIDIILMIATGGNVGLMFGFHHMTAGSPSLSTLFTGATAALRGSKITSAFSAGKHAIRALTQNLGKEFAPQDIHVAHVIIDGLILTSNNKKSKNSLEWEKDKAARLDPESIAKDRSSWTWELDLRPAHENW